jgi:hypothetical protein
MARLYAIVYKLAMGLFQGVPEEGAHGRWRWRLDGFPFLHLRGWGNRYMVGVWTTPCERCIAYVWRSICDGVYGWVWYKEYNIYCLQVAPTNPLVHHLLYLSMVCIDSDIAKW